MRGRRKLWAILYPMTMFLACVLNARRVCYARLGESEQQLITRYGESERSDNPENAWDDKTLTFSSQRKDGTEILIIANLLNGVCVGETYVFLTASGEPLPLKGELGGAADVLVNANSQGHLWRGLPGPPPEGMERLWVRSDNESTSAIIWTATPHALEVISAQARARMKQVDAGLGGF